MVTWRDSLHNDGRGSFRGVHFYVSAAESSIGRSVVVHRFPGRNAPAVEDTGRAPREFKLTCFVVGPNYVVERDLLYHAFEKAGPGQLVHPYWGELKVNITSPVRVRETTAEGGMARFDLAVVEVSDIELTIAELDLEPLVDAAATAAVAAASEDFEDSFSLTGAIEAVRLAAVATVQTASSAIADVRGPINAAVNVVDDTGAAITDLSDNASSLINTPSSLAGSVFAVTRSIFTGLSKLDQTTADLIAAGQQALELTDKSSFFDDYRATRALEAFRALTTNGDDLAEVQLTGSGQSAIESANQNAIVRLNQTAAAIEGARAFAVFDFASRDRASEVRDQVAETLATLAEGASDATYNRLIDLRATVAAQLAAVASTLPRVIEVTPYTAQPALVLAYDLYDDLAMETDIIVRNNITNPMQVPGMVALQVIDRG